MTMQSLQGSMLQPAREPSLFSSKKEREKMSKIQLMNSFVQLIAKRDLVVFQNDTQGLLKLSHNSFFFFVYQTYSFAQPHIHERGSRMERQPL